MKLFGFEIGGSKKASSAANQMMFDDSFEEEEVANVEVFNRDQNGVLKISGKDYAVGMFWNSASDANSAVSEAKSAAKSVGLGADFYCVRGEIMPQYGLGYKDSGHKSGMPSLASHLNDAVEGNWIGVFPYGDSSFYLVAVRDDAILADCDKVFTSEDDAREEFSDLFYSSNWENAFAPEAWELEGTTEKFFDDLLLGSPVVKLKDVSSAKVIIKFGGILAVLFIILFVGMQLYNTFFATNSFEQVTAVYNQVQTKIIAKKGVEEQDQEVPPAPPWLGKPTGIGMLANCYSMITDLPITVPGWKVAGTMCVEGSTSMLLTRDGGTINWIGYELNKLEDRELPMIVPLDKSTVEVSYNNPSLVVYPESVPTYSLDNVQRYLISHFDEAFLDIEIDFKGNSEILEQDPRLPRYYKSLKFKFESPYNPSEFTEILSKLPVFIINKVEYSIENDVWLIEAEVFEKRPSVLPAKDNY